MRIAVQGIRFTSEVNESALSLIFLSKPRQVFYPLLAYLPEEKMYMKQSQSFV